MLLAQHQRRLISLRVSKLSNYKALIYHRHKTLHQSLAPAGYTVLAQRHTNKLIVYNSSTLSILLDTANPIGQFRVPTTDGKELMLFITGSGSSNCLFKYDYGSNTIQAINSVTDVCNAGQFTDNHITVFVNSLVFFSKETF